MTNNPNLTLKNILSTIKTAPTLTQVAKWLYTSQPNISKTIHEAEQKYQVKLVNRNQIPISLTPAGQQLLIRLNQILSLEEDTVNELMSFQKNPTFSLYLAFFPTYASIILPIVVPNLLKEFPHIKIKSISMTTSKALDLLKSGKVSIFLGRSASDPDIVALPLFTEKLCFVINKKSPLYQERTFIRELKQSELKNLQKENYIKWSTETSFIDVTEHFFTLNDMHFSSNLTVSNYEEAMFCAAKGLGTTMAMLHTANHFLSTKNNVNLLVIPEKMASLEISIMFKKDASNLVKQIAKETTQLLLSL